MVTVVVEEQEEDEETSTVSVLETQTLYMQLVSALTDADIEAIIQAVQRTYRQSNGECIWMLFFVCL